MEKAVARVKFEGLDGGDETSASEVESSESEEEEREVRELVMKHNRKGKKSGGFQSMGLSHAVFKGVMRKGYRIPTPIQRRCIPLVLDGRDVVAMARTGSGKTAAFLVPLFERLKTHSAKIGARALILSPTRELATQTMKFTKELGKFTTLRATLVLGGDRMEEQFAAMHENPDVIIATPGRFLHLMVEMELRLSSIQYVVFDEADRLFEMGFSEQLHEILHRLPEARQTLLFSATLPKLLVQFAKAGLQEPVLVRLDVDSALSEQLGLTFLATRSEDKPALLLHLLRHVVAPSNQTVVFTATKHHVEYLKELLLAAGMDCSVVYSSLDQTARKINVAKFVNKKTKLLLVTDVAARGIDIPMLDNVINYNFPAKAKLFVHRVGRVARAGRSGHAYSLVSADEVAYMLDLHLFLGRAVQLARRRGVDAPRVGTGTYGSVPQTVIDDEQESIRHFHEMSSADLDDLKTVSDNAQKQYMRSRPQPAPESIKRAKELPSSVPTHPIFEDYCSSQELERSQLLDSLRAFRPPHTILEVHSTARSTAKHIMKTKREYHSGVVAANQQKKGSVGAMEDERGKEKDVYLHHTPADLYSEKGLSLGTSFDQQAAGAQLDLDGDEGVGLVRSKVVLKWDRKRKKYIGDSGKEGRKKVKTESGRVIAASYKTNIYQQWRGKHKVEGGLVGQEDEDRRERQWRGRGKKGGGRGRGRGGQKEVRGGEPGGLKSTSEILRKRKKRDFQDTMRNIKLQRKSGEGGGRGRGHRGRTGGRGRGRQS